MSGPVGNNNQDPAAVAAVAAAAAAAAAVAVAAAVEEDNGRVAPELNQQQQESADRAAVVATNVLAHQQKEAQKVSSNKEDKNKPESGEGKEAVEVAVEVVGQEVGEEDIAGNSSVVTSESSSEEVEVGRQPSDEPLQQPPVGDNSAPPSQGTPATSVSQSSSTPSALGETGRTHKGDVTHSFIEIKLANGGTEWKQSSIKPKTSDPSEKASNYLTVSNVSTLLGIATEATRAAGLAGECVDRLGIAGGFFKGANTAMGIVETGVKVVDAVDKGIAFVQNGKNLDKGLAFGGAAANAAAAGVSATKNLTEAGIIPISPEVNTILGGIGQGLKFVAGVFNIAEATKKLVDNRFTVKGEKVSEILKIAAAVAVIFMAIVGIIALFGVGLPALLLPIAGVAVAVSALASGIVKGIVSSNKNKFAKSLINGEPCAVAV